MTDTVTPSDASLLTAIAEVPAAAWARWFGDRIRETGEVPSRTLVASFSLPAGTGHAALCLFDTALGATDPAGTTLNQAAIRRWAGAAPPEAMVLYEHTDTDGVVLWTLADAWADPDLRDWLREALSAGASLRADGWEWHAAPERPAVSHLADGPSRVLTGRRHDVVILEPSAVAVVYRRLTRNASPELELLRHLERVPSILVAPPILGSAIIVSPAGQRTASSVLVEIPGDSDTVRSIVVSRLRRSLEGDPSLQAVALDDVRAVGVIARELHAALGRPFDQGIIAGAVPAIARDVDTWVARAAAALASVTLALTSAPHDGELAAGLALLPGKLQQFAAVAESAPGLIHRVHGTLTLDTVLISPPRVLRVVELDGDALLSDIERITPQSPWRDVARLLVSIAEAAIEAARAAGGDAKALEIAWLWEREARKACLEGYGTGGGALHALLAIFEVEFASRLLLDGLLDPQADRLVASHTLQRLSRTIV